MARKGFVYCTIPLIGMQGYHTNTKDTGIWGYSSVCYITSRIGWVSLNGRMFNIAGQLPEGLILCGRRPRNITNYNTAGSNG